MVRMTVELPKTAYIRDLKRVVGERMNVDPEIVFSFNPLALMIAAISRNIFEKVL
jgi:hypothetical protein